MIIAGTIKSGGSDWVLLDCGECDEDRGRESIWKRSTVTLLNGLSQRQMKKLQLGQQVISHLCPNEVEQAARPGYLSGSALWVEAIPSEAGFDPNLGLLTFGLVTGFRVEHIPFSGPMPYLILSAGMRGKDRIVVECSGEPLDFMGSDPIFKGLRVGELVGVAGWLGSLKVEPKKLTVWLPSIEVLKCTGDNQRLFRIIVERLKIRF